MARAPYLPRIPKGLLFPLSRGVSQDPSRDNTVGMLPPITALTIMTTSLPYGTVGVPYSQTLQASGGTQPYTWTVHSSSLPTGLALSSAGVISGTPTTTETSSFTVQVQDDLGTIATKPLSIVVTGGKPYAYVTNFSSNNVSVIDLSTNTVTTTITVGTNPRSVAVNPAGTYAYVGNYNSNNVSVIDLSTNTVTTTIPVGTGPYAIAINPAGTYAYVTNYGTATVSVIDLSTNTVTTTITVGTDPYGIAINRNSLDAAIFEMCVYKEKPAAFWAIHNQLDQRVDLKNIDKAGLKPIFAGFMVQAGIPTPKVQACIDQSRPLPDISKAGDTLTSHIGVPSTPVFIVDGQVKSGYLSYDDIKQIFAQESQKASPPKTN